MNRRQLLRAVAACTVAAQAAPTRAQGATLRAEALQRLKRGGAVLIVRHTDTTPGSGDPAGFQLYDCSTQRNLIDEGRTKAQLLGQALAVAEVNFEMVMSSEWCRCVETANLVFGVQPATWQPLNYTFASFDEEQRARARLRTLVSGWRGRDNLALVTHTPNVTALTGRSPAWNQAYVLVPIKGGNDWVTLDLN